MIEITNYRQGAILNHNHGKEGRKSLKVTVEGISEGGWPVTVNGQPAVMEGRRFAAEVELTQRVNPVKASVVTPYGTYSQELTLVWDKKSFKRFNFFIDDHSFLFTDLSKQRPKKAFDHFYLAGLKKIHDQYGLKVTLNSFYHNDHDPFDLKDMPAIWKSEFEDNSDWLKFSFHAYSEFPDRPYAEATAETFGRHWDMVQKEIERFAGPKSFIAPVVIHWANVHPAVAQEAIRRGVTAYSNNFRLRVMGGPSLEDRQRGGDMKTVEKRSLSGVDCGNELSGLAMHYGMQEEKDFMDKNIVYYDPQLGICFFHNTVLCNLTPLAEIPKKYAEAIKRNEERGTEILGVGSHEQYTFPYYGNYLPDHMKRLETATRCLVEADYKPVFFSQGFLGNPNA
ncbi:MAG: hypothetical protein IKX30_01485 [Victivallales bacterium]|nr:hypothetical protein [Victivallales bacterium]